MGTVMAIKEPKPQRTLDVIASTGQVGKVTHETVSLTNQDDQVLAAKRILGLRAEPPRLRASAVDSGLAEYFDSRKQMVLRQQFTVMGSVDGIATENGPLRFGKHGPILATFNDGTLGFISEWPGLPIEWIPTGKLCQHCQAKCDECKGKGVRGCVYPGC